MRIHHFYPRTNNIGDHFVQIGIERMIRTIVPEATFQLFNVNSRGENKQDFGLTQSAIERANRQADLIIIGGSNLYEGGFRWPWGVNLDVRALGNLRVPMFLLGIGSGSDFCSPLHQPSGRAKSEIKILNDYAVFSGARDVITFDWLQQLGISKAKLTGDPATFIFNQPVTDNPNGHILITMPPHRFWTSKRRFWKVRARGRAMFRALAGVARTLQEQGHKLLVTCNDPMDVTTAESLFKGWQASSVVCPDTPEKYFQLLSSSRAVISGRLHTASVAFSLGIPFLLLDADQRTHGFLKTYQLEQWSVAPSLAGIDECLRGRTDRLLDHEELQSWKFFIEKRNLMYSRAMDMLRGALKSLR